MVCGSTSSGRRGWRSAEPVQLTLTTVAVQVDAVGQVEREEEQLAGDLRTRSTVPLGQSTLESVTSAPRFSSGSSAVLPGVPPSVTK